MPSYGPWVQPDDHTFDYYAAYQAGHGEDPEAVDPEFARLPPSLPWGSFIDPDNDGDGYYASSITDRRKFSQFRPVGSGSTSATTWVGPDVPFTDVAGTWDNGDYTSPTQAQVDFIAAWLERWDYAKVWQADGEPYEYGNMQVGPSGPPSEYGSPWWGGPRIALDMNRMGSYNSYPWNGAYADVGHSVGISYYRAGDDYLLQYRPNVELPDGASIEWEGLGSVVGASIYIKTGRMTSGVQGGAYGSDQPGLNGVEINGEGAMVYASYHARNWHYDYTAGQWQYEILPEIHGDFYPCRIILRRHPTLGKKRTSGYTYHLYPDFAAPSTYAAHPVIYDGDPIAGTDDALLLDVTGHLDPDDGNSLTILAHLSDFQLDGVLPTLHPTGYDIGKADFAGFSAVMNDGWFSSYGPINNFNWPTTEETPLPYMVWTIRPPRYRFVYNDNYAHPNMAGAERGGGVNFVAAR